MMPTPRAHHLAHFALASTILVGCAESDEPSVDAPAYALATTAADAAAAADASPDVSPGAPASGLSFSVEGAKDFKLVVPGASCAGNRCTLATVPSTEIRVDLTLNSHGMSDMPVWVRWRGCTPKGGQLWPMWSGGQTPEYQTLYTHGFEGLAPGSACVAEVVQGTWYIFAGNLSVKPTTNAQYCREQYSSPENLNLHCFVPAKQEVTIESTLRSWQCFIDGAKRATAPTVFRTGNLKFTAAGNEVVSCTGMAL